MATTERQAGAWARAFHRAWATARARLQRAGVTARRAVLTDTDVTVDTREAEIAEAESLVEAGGALGAAVAKALQLRAYLEAPDAPRAAEARAVLGRLWDQMPGADPAGIRRVVEEDLGAQVSERFAAWDDRPLAAASLGQVHAATSHEGAALAVKVQYPGVAEALRADVESRAVLRSLVGSDLGARVDEAALDRLRAQLLAELDYRAEAAWLERFALAFAGDAAIVLPRAVRALSGARVLTMSRLDGQPLMRFAAEAPLEARNAVARVLFRFAWGAPILHGLFNADPNPGNYLVLGEGRVGFVDFGSVGELTDEQRAAERQLWLAVIHRNGEALRHAAHLEGLVGDPLVFDSAVWREWERLLLEPFLRKDETALEPERVKALVERTGELLRMGRLSLPADSLLLWRQRLGSLSVLAALRPRLPFRRMLAELLDDRRNPMPLLERYP